MRHRPDVAGLAGTVVLVAFLAWFGVAQSDDYAWLDLGIRALALATALVGLNLLVGQIGLLSLGHYAFLVYGGYFGAVWAVESWGLDPRLGFPVAFVGGLLLGTVLALTCCHLRGFYLTVVTLAFGLIAASLALVIDRPFNGMSGRSVVEPLDTNFWFIDANEPNRPFIGLYWLAAGLLLLTTFLVANLVHSRIGRAYRAIRESELAARASGVSTYWYKVSAFALSAAFTSMAGVVTAQTDLQTTIPEGTAIVGQSFRWVIYLFFGGIGTLAGPIVGALTFKLGFSFHLGGGKSVVERLGEWQTLFEGALVVVLAIAVPQGIVGTVASAGSRLRARMRPGGGQVPDPPTAGESCFGPRTPPGAVGGLEVEGLSIRFGGLLALQDVDLRVRPGTVHSLIGPNGSGKSTLINIVSGIYSPGSGRCCLHDDDITARTSQARNRLGITRTFQTCQIWRRMSVLDNVLVGAHSRQRTGFVRALLLPPWLRREERAMRARAWALLHFVGLAARGHDLAGTLPFADQRRLEIARALASDPDVLLLDEPAAGMHADEITDLLALVRAIRDTGIAVLLVEHHMDVVMELSDVVTVLDQGAVIASGTPVEVAADPRVIQAYLGENAEPAAARVGGPDDTDPTTALAVAPEPALVVRGLNVRYGAATALVDVALAVNMGEVVTLIGGNGAGKTTTLKTISGVYELLRWSRAEIELFGHRIDRLPAHRIARFGLAHVPEGRRVFAESSVEENLLLGGYLRTAEERRDGLEEAYARFPVLAERRGQPAGLLSGGEQQMLAIARGLMSRPRLLLLDEPSLGLAPIVAEEVFAAIRALADDGLTILLVEQMAGRALMVADRAYVLENGRIAREGTAADLAADVSVREAYLGRV